MFSPESSSHEMTTPPLLDEPAKLVLSPEEIEAGLTLSKSGMSTLSPSDRDDLLIARLARLSFFYDF